MHRIVLLQVPELTPEQPAASGWLSNFPSTRLKDNLHALKGFARYSTGSHELAAGFILELAIYSDTPCFPSVYRVQHALILTVAHSTLGTYRTSSQYVVYLFSYNLPQ